jgi:alkylation response protein AidB-like acyl-CoA dehydrogenase
MDFAPDERLERFQSRTRELLRRAVTPEMVERAHATGTMHDWDLHRAIAETGLLAEGMASDTRSGRDPLELYVLFDELGLANAPYSGLGTTMLVAGVLDELGTEFHRHEVMPRLHAGEAIVALGYTEPDAGSDVAAASTRAELAHDGSGDWIINGQKMFTTLAHESSYVLLLTRTNAEVAKHLGLTMFLVPLDLPGIEIQPVMTMGGDRTNITFYTDVRVADRWRVGDVGGGWEVMKVALAYERGVFGNTNQAMSLLERCRAWAASAVRPDGTRVIDDPLVRVRLARIAIDNEVTSLLTLRAAFMASEGGHPTIEGAVAKLFASEAYTRAAEACQSVAGPSGLLEDAGDGAAANGWIDHAARDAPVTTIYAGTSEIQRNLIAERHLGLPKTR